MYAKSVTGITKSIGYAGTAKAEGTIPRVGAIGLMASWGHAVVIQAIHGDTVTITESNWVRGKIDTRELPLTAIRGYIY